MVRPGKKRRRKLYVGPRSAQPKVPWARPNPHLILYIIILYYNIILNKKNQKKFPTNFKNHFKKIVIFSNIFLPILHNIGLYIYTVKYKFGIKIPGFLRNISKKNQNIIYIYIYYCIRSNPKIFPSILFLKK